jgi:hypothetical protein
MDKNTEPNEVHVHQVITAENGRTPEIVSQNLFQN